VANVTEDDVMAAVKVAWDASPLGTGAPALALGGLWHARAPESTLTVGAYGVMTCRTAGYEWVSSKTTMRDFELSVEVRSKATPTDIDALRTALANLLDRGALTVAGADKVLWCAPADGERSVEDEYSDGQDVQLAAGRWDVRVQYTRP
jgi:hypothetical protein